MDAAVRRPYRHEEGHGVSVRLDRWGATELTRSPIEDVRSRVVFSAARGGSNAPEADIRIAPESGRSVGWSDGVFRPKGDKGDPDL
jgi:hypothetical protein